MLDTVILLTGAVEQTALGAVLRHHSPQLTIVPAASLTELAAIEAAVLRRARLIGFVTPVVVPARILNALGFGAYNFHPGPPHYPGWAPAHFAVYEKAATFGATVHKMIARVDAGPIVDAELFAIPPGKSPGRLQEMAFVLLARMFWRLAPLLAKGEPLAERPMQWSGTKSTRRMHAAMCALTADISQQELQRRIEAFGAGDFGVELTVTLHGRKFRYVAPETDSIVAQPAAASTAMVA